MNYGTSIIIYFDCFCLQVMNEKLSHCIELNDLVSSKLNDVHHIRLEWMIIVLIMVEVVFEFLHYADRYLDHQPKRAVPQEVQTV